MLTRRIHAAFDYAADAHTGHSRKGTQIPYLSHLMAVSSLVMEAAADGEAELPDDFEDLVIAGLLHDVVEDCGGPPRLAEVRARFGQRVGDIVAHCTDDLPAQGEPKAPWAERKRAYLEHLAQQDDYRALLVSAADKLHNTRSIVTDLRKHRREDRPPEAFWRRFVDDKPDAKLDERVPEILWYYKALADVLSRKAEEESRQAEHPRLGRLAGELESAVDEMLGFAAEAGFELRAPGVRPPD